MTRRIALLVLVLTASACASASSCGSKAPELTLAQGAPASLAALALEASPPAEADSLAETRTAFQTDGAGAAWLDGLTGAVEGAGLTVGGERVVDAWTWHLDADSVDLGPAERTRGIARPDFAVRAYAAPDTSGFFTALLNDLQHKVIPHLAERVTLLDRRGALLVEVPDSIGTVGFRPIAGDRRAADAFTVQKEGDALLFARTDRAADTTGAAVWTAVVATGSGGAGNARGTRAAALAVPKGADPLFTLGEMAVETPARLVVATGATPALAAAAARAALGQATALREARSNRMAAILETAPLVTADARTNSALNWALLSLDALVVQADSGRAILLPGLPGMEPTTVASTMEAVPAFLAAGQWDTARALLLTTAKAQVFDRRLHALGRAPDVVTVKGEPVFATAEATPLFLAAAGDVVRATGERSLLTGSGNFWFKTVFALRGIYEKDTRNGSQTDTLGFLTTRDGRGTPRDGDPTARGVVRTGAPAEAQGALLEALRSAADFSRIMGVSQRSTAKWYADTSGVLVTRFEQAYGRSPLLADRLDAQQRAAPDVRPGGLIALARMQGAMPDAKRARLARPLAERLVFPYGVASLAQSDSLFHPYVDSRGGYSLASARTEGSVWTSLAGPVVALMAQTGGAEAAATLFGSQVDFLLDRGTLGAIPELVDGHPREADAAPGVGGVPVTPWPLAGLLTSAIEGFAGARYASPDTLVVEPTLPEAWGETTLRMRLGGGTVTLHLTQTAGGLDASVVSRGALPAGATLRLRAGGADAVLALVTKTDTTVAARDSFAVAMTGGTVTVNGASADAKPLAAAPETWNGFDFATPDIQDVYPVTRARIERRALAPAQVRRDNPGATVALTQTDPAGDDWGSTSTFTYPEDVPAGALDVTYLEVARDDSTTYVRIEFSALPEGDPKAMVAIVLDTEEGGERRLARNARYAFPAAEAFDYVLFVGTDLVVEDAQGNELGRLDDAGLYDAATGSLTFAIPTSILPRPPRGTKVTVLVGARADGDTFRDVVRGTAGVDGGGRAAADSPNIYDVVVGTM